MCRHRLRRTNCRALDWSASPSSPVSPGKSGNLRMRRKLLDIRRSPDFPGDPGGQTIPSCRVLDDVYFPDSGVCLSVSRCRMPTTAKTKTKTKTCWKSCPPTSCSNQWPRHCLRKVQAEVWAGTRPPSTTLPTQTSRPPVPARPLKSFLDQKVLIKLYERATLES